MRRLLRPPPPALPPQPPLAKRVRHRLLGLPWWALLLLLLFVYAGYEIARSERYQDILWSMLDNPQWTTEDRFDVVYEVDEQVLVVAQKVLLTTPAGERITVPLSEITLREAGTLPCDQAAEPNCLDEFGEIITFRSPAQPSETPDGTLEQQGVARALGNIVDLPGGGVAVVPEEAILNREAGTLACNPIRNPGCEDLTGTIVTFEVPYVLRQGLLAREDVLIRHTDGYEETVRPNRLRRLETLECTPDEETPCYQGQVTRALFRDRVVGTEIGREDGQIRVRTVDQETAFVPTERIIGLDTGLVECDRSANPRCTDFQGTFVQQRGAITEGELSLETNRAVRIIPTGESAAVEVFKRNIISDERTPPNCRVEDEGTCLIRVEEDEATLAGRILGQTDDGILLETVAPVVVELPAEDVQALRRAPRVCALDNLRGCNQGIWLTLLVTVTAYSLALIIGLLVGLMRVSSNPLLFHGATFYVELIRGVPLLVLLLFFAFVVGPIIRDTETLSILGRVEIPIGVVTQGFYSSINEVEVLILGEESFLAEAVLGLAIGYGAFLAEVFRAGIQSIPRGQIEAARSLGLNYRQIMRHVVLPQAVRIVLPPLGNDFIAMLKDSALISVLALPDLLQMGRLYINAQLP
ncbi:MAG: amino acid ABC transporter permease, partial [Anaerolineae bacterium]|nr:amino acid ABC transporter permease [Anaerolineae bacterium]